MKAQSLLRSCVGLLGLPALLIGLGALVASGQAPNPDEHAAHHPPAGDPAVTPPEAAAPVPPPANATRPGMGGGPGMGGMMKMMKKGMGKNAAPAAPAQPDGCNCGMMGMMEGGNAMSLAPTGDRKGDMEPNRRVDRMGRQPGRPGVAAQPGVPGSSHLFNIGANGFFLNHQPLLALSVAQQKTLRQLREKTWLEQAEFGRKLASAEQELWVLMSQEKPELNRIAAQLAASESVRTGRRLSFVKAVLEAAATLTDEQRQILLGTRTAPAPK